MWLAAVPSDPAQVMLNNFDTATLQPTGSHTPSELQVSPAERNDSAKIKQNLKHVAKRATNQLVAQKTIQKRHGGIQIRFREADKRQPRPCLTAQQKESRTLLKKIGGACLMCSSHSFRVSTTIYLSAAFRTNCY